MTIPRPRSEVTLLMPGLPGVWSCTAGPLAVEPAPSALSQVAAPLITKEPVALEPATVSRHTPSSFVHTPMFAPESGIAFPPTQIVPASCVPSPPVFAGTKPPSHRVTSIVLQSALHASVPGAWPRLAQVAPPTSLPSHSSSPFLTPSPHRPQPMVSNVHVVLHVSAPLSNPSERQVAPPRSVPSHCSPGSRMPLPQPVQLRVS